MQPKRKRKVSKHPTPTISCDELFVPILNKKQKLLTSPKYHE